MQFFLDRFFLKDCMSPPLPQREYPLLIYICLLQQRGVSASQKRYSFLSALAQTSLTYTLSPIKRIASSYRGKRIRNRKEKTIIFKLKVLRDLKTIINSILRAQVGSYYNRQNLGAYNCTQILSKQQFPNVRSIITLLGQLGYVFLSCLL